MQSVRFACRAGSWPAIAVLWVLAVSPLEGQNRLPTASGDWMLRNLRPSGQPVIPLFDGWYHNPDGTFELCFGFHNLNTAQEVEIPLGPDNFIDPARFDGLQPTHFDEVPSEYRRRFCVFFDTPRGPRRGSCDRMDPWDRGPDLLGPRIEFGALSHGRA